MTRKDDEPARIWVPACATGEEAVSIAVLFEETLERLNRRIPLQGESSDLFSAARRIHRDCFSGIGEAHKEERRIGRRTRFSRYRPRTGAHSTRENLQATIEEIETSNEELKSTNEGLQSANEELQGMNEEVETAKEELQSVNEELKSRLEAMEAERGKETPSA
jgi:chromosome segregation ATPase